MKRLLILWISLLVMGVAALAQAPFQNERLHYVISYKWGLIHKDAGDATLTLRRNGQNYDIMLTAVSKPWVDRFYMVRDTLKGVVSSSGLRPLSYTKLTHEKGKHKKDVITYKYAGAGVSAVATRYRYDDAGRPSVKQAAFSSAGPAFDMLSIFYYIRRIDYARLKKNDCNIVTVFSGRQKETVEIRYLGREMVTLKDKSRREAYHIKFRFTRDGGKKSSEDMDTWISTDASHVPLLLVGKLPIGEIRATLL